MRRIAYGMLVMAAMSCGCQSMQTPWGGQNVGRGRAIEATQGAELDEPTQTAKAVSDATMLRGHMQGGFNDSPVGP